MCGLLGEWRGIFQFGRRSSFDALVSAQQGESSIERRHASRHSDRAGRRNAAAVSAETRPAAVVVSRLAISRT